MDDGPAFGIGPGSMDANAPHIRELDPDVFIVGAGHNGDVGDIPCSPKDDLNHQVR